MMMLFVGRCLMLWRSSVTRVFSPANYKRFSRPRIFLEGGKGKIIPCVLVESFLSDENQDIWHLPLFLVNK